LFLGKNKRITYIYHDGSEYLKTLQDINDQ